MMNETKQEYFDIVDENNNPTGQKATRYEVHTEGLWHRTVHVYLFRKMNNDIEFLVHLRAKTKDLNPNKWDTRFGGHLKSGETIEEAVAGELQDEISLTLESANLIQGEVLKRDKFPNREFTNVYYYKFLDELSSLNFNDGEVQEIKWMKSSDILKSLAENPEMWSASKNGFSEILITLQLKL